MAEINSLTGLVSQSQLSGIVSDIVTLIHTEDTNVTNAYKALVGNLGKNGEGEDAVDHTVKSYVDAAIAEVNGDNTALKARVKANEDALTLLNNNAQTVGSVDYKIDQAFNDFMTKVSDDNTVNTFKELLDYAASHKGEYTDLVTLVGTLPEGCGVTTVVAYAAKVAADAQKEADDRLDAIEADYLKAADKTEVEGKITALENGAVATNAANITAEQTRAEGVEASIIAAINANALATDAEIAAIKALIK